VAVVLRPKPPSQLEGASCWVFSSCVCTCCVVMWAAGLEAQVSGCRRPHPRQSSIYNAPNQWWITRGCC
jgi:hypothetical protein